MIKRIFLLFILILCNSCNLYFIGYDMHTGVKRMYEKHDEGNPYTYSVAEVWNDSLKIIQMKLYEYVSTSYISWNQLEVGWNNPLPNYLFMNYEITNGIVKILQYSNGIFNMRVITNELLSNRSEFYLEPWEYTSLSEVELEDSIYQFPITASNKSYNYSRSAFFIENENRTFAVVSNNKEMICFSRVSRKKFYHLTNYSSYEKQTHLVNGFTSLVIDSSIALFQDLYAVMDEGARELLSELYFSRKSSKGLSVNHKRMKRISQEHYALLNAYQAYRRGDFNNCLSHLDSTLSITNIFPARIMRLNSILALNKTMSLEGFNELIDQNSFFSSYVSFVQEIIDEETEFNLKKDYSDLELSYLYGFAELSFELNYIDVKKYLSVLKELLQYLNNPFLRVPIALSVLRYSDDSIIITKLRLELDESLFHLTFLPTEYKKIYIKLLKEKNMI